jgi:RNase P protein component
MMEAGFFNNDHTVVFLIITSAAALTWSVVGLTIPRRMRSDIKRQLRELLWQQLPDWFDALVRVRPDNIEDLQDAQFRSRAGQLIAQARGNKAGRSRKQDKQLRANKGVAV